MSRAGSPRPAATLSPSRFTGGVLHSTSVRLSAFLLLGIAASATAQEPAAPAAALPAPPTAKVATAQRVAAGAIRVDGRLDEADWQRATPISDFVQKEPV